MSATRLGTTITLPGGAVIGVIEHLMAAIAIAGLDNVEIEVEGDEMPVLDGSAAPFLEAVYDVGIVQQLGAGRPLRIVESIEVCDGPRRIRVEPADRSTLDLSIDFPDAVIGRQSVCLDLDDGAALRRRLAPARTFCRLADVEEMRAAGLARGGSLDNAIVVDDAALLNRDGLRDPQEFALHKALDLIGDLRLVGWPIAGRIEAERPGHDLNNRLARALADAAEAWGVSSPAESD